MLVPFHRQVSQALEHAALMEGQDLVSRLSDLQPCSLIHTCTVYKAKGLP
jgi:hypothetical protein